MTGTAPAERPRLGFLGLGHIGRLRLESLVRAGVADVAALADCSASLCEPARALAPDARVCASLPELLSCNLDGVVIATPSALHASQSIAALERGLAVFCQKPLARTANETRAVLDAARRADRLLAVDLSYRRTQAVAALKALLDDRAIGDVYAAELVFHNAYGPGGGWFYDVARAGGGCLIDLGTHLIDLLRWTVDDPVARVSSRLYAGGRRLTPPLTTVEDFASVSIDLASGATATIGCSWKLHAGRDAVIDCRWFGTRGGLRFANVNGSFFDFVAERFDGTRTSTLASPPDEWGGRTLVAWANALAHDRRYDPSCADVLAVADVLDRAYGL
jgi:predicted dehydrogenase